MKRILRIFTHPRPALAVVLSLVLDLHKRQDHFPNLNFFLGTMPT